MPKPISTTADATLNLSQLAREHNISRDTLYLWIKRGWLKARCVAGTRAKYTRADYDRACALSRGEKPETVRAANPPTARAFPKGFWDMINAM